MSKLKNKPHVRFRLERHRATGQWVWDYQIHEPRWPVLQTVRMQHIWAANQFIACMNAKEGRPRVS